MSALRPAVERDELFRADIVDIEAVIRANYDFVVEVVREAPAEQYRAEHAVAQG